MCWSFQASLITWIIAVIVSVYFLNRRNKNDIVMGGLILIYSSMQLWESFMWYDQKCGSINIFGTKMAYWALWAHVLAAAIGLYIEYKVTAPLIIGIGLLVLAYVRQPSEWYCSKPGANGHLIWGFDPAFYVLVFSLLILILLYYIKPFKTACIISALVLASLIISVTLYGTGVEVSSFWCWICAIFSFIFIFANN